MNIVEINSTNSRLMIKAVLPLTQLRLHLFTYGTYFLTYLLRISNNYLR